MDTWFRTELRKRMQRQWITWALLTVGLLAWAAADASFWRNFIAGPQHVDAAQLAQLDASPTVPARYFLTVDGTKAVDTGVRDTESRDGQTSNTGAYSALLVGDRILIVRGDSLAGTTVTGDLKPIPPEVASLLFSGADAVPQSSTYPLMLDTRGFRARGYLAIAGAVVWTLLLVFFGLRSFRRAQEITLHPATQRVEAWPNSFADLQAAEREAETAVRFRTRFVLVTDSFIIQRSFFIFNVYRMDELVWAFEKITQRRIYGIIPAGKTYALVMRFAGGRAVAMQGKRELVEGVLPFLQAQAPRALYGFTKEWGKAWRSNTAGFEQQAPLLRAAQLGGSEPPPPMKGTKFMG